MNRIACIVIGAFWSIRGPNEMTKDGYVVASPRVIDKLLLEKSLAELELAVENEDEKRAIALLSHIVPEYSASSHADDAERASGSTKSKSN